MNDLVSLTLWAPGQLPRFQPSSVLWNMTNCGIEPPFISLPASSRCWSVLT